MQSIKYVALSEQNVYKVREFPFMMLYYIYIFSFDVTFFVFEWIKMTYC